MELNARNKIYGMRLRERIHYESLTISCYRPHTRITNLGCQKTQTKCQLSPLFLSPRAPKMQQYSHPYSQRDSFPNMPLLLYIEPSNKRSMWPYTRNYKSSAHKGIMVNTSLSSSNRHASIGPCLRLTQDPRSHCVSFASKLLDVPGSRLHCAEPSGSVLWLYQETQQLYGKPSKTMRTRRDIHAKLQATSLSILTPGQSTHTCIVP